MGRILIINHDGFYFIAHEGILMDRTPECEIISGLLAPFSGLTLGILETSDGGANSFNPRIWI